MRVALATVAIAAAAGASCAVAAQDVYTPTGSRIGRPAPATTPNKTNLSAEDKGRQVTNQLASCLYRSNVQAANDALALPPDSKESSEAIGALVRGDCYAAIGNLRVSHSLMRGALFRARFESQFGWDDAALAPEPVDYRKFVPSPLQPENYTYVALGDFADCVVRSDLEDARTFVEQEAGSEGETRALNALMPHLGPCLIDGLKVTFSKAVIEGLLSEAIYHETAAAVAGGAGR